MAMSQRMWKREQERKRRERMKRARHRRNCAITVFVAAVVAVIIILSKSCDDSSSPLSESVTPPVVPVDIATPQPLADVPFKSSVDISTLDLSSFENSAFVGNAVAASVSLYNLLPETDFYSDVNLDLENVYTTAAGYDSLAVADQLKSKKFSRVYLCFGERELMWDDSAKFGIEYRELISKIKEYQPSASIYVLSIPPVTRSASEQNLYGANMKTIKEYNRKIRNMAYSEKLYYVDSVAALGRNGGFLTEGVSYDGINLNREYVIELISYIKNKAYIPNTPAADIEEDEESLDTATAKPTKEPTASGNAEIELSPEPTVNVLKDSAIKKSEN